MKYTKWSRLAIVLLAFSPAAVIAAEASKTFNELDNDGDGYISKSEATSRADLRQNWNSVDANKDGKLTEAEFSAFESVSQEALPEK